MAYIKPEHEWLAHVQPTGLVVSTLVLDELSLIPPVQDALATAQFAELLNEDDGPLLPDAWALLHGVLGWPAAMVAGLTGSEPVPVELCHSLADHETLLEPTYALKGAGGDGWQLLVRVEQHGIDPDARGALPGWEATPHQRFERLLRETGVGTGLLITNRAQGDVEQAELRLITAPRGETSGWISWPLRSLTSVAGRQMLGGLKLLLGSFTLFNAPENARLPALLKASRERQAEVSTKRDARRMRWWRFGDMQPGLYASLKNVDRAIVTSSQAGAYTVFAIMPTDVVFSSNLNVFSLPSFAHFSALSARSHELWALMFGSSMADTPTYTVDTCFKTFPLPFGSRLTSVLETIGEAYQTHRAAMMVATDKGMTKTYNRFHDPHDRAADVVELRRLHAAMDDAVLRAYGWDDLATRAAGEDAPRFLTEDDEDDHKYQKRLFWPAPFRDELLARLLELNEERAEAEKVG